MIKKIAVVTLVGVLLLALTAVTQADKGGNKDGEDGSFSNKSLKGTYSFRLAPATGFAPFYDGTAGKPDSGVATAPRQDILRVGVFTADGAGNLTGRTIATTDDGLTTIKIDFMWTGTYTVNTDGTGTLSINPDDNEIINSCVDGSNPPNPIAGCQAFEGPETYAFVLNNHGEDKLVSLTQTDNDGGGAKIFLTGEAKKNSGSGDDDDDDDDEDWWED